MADIVVENLAAGYGKEKIFSDVSLKISSGDFVGILGPNGAGKSTLMRVILGFIKSDKGRIFVKKNSQKISIKNYKKQIAYVPQKQSIDWTFPVTVFEVVLMGTYGNLGWFRRPGKREKNLALEALQKVQMEDFADRAIGELSGGQRQRVFLARALAQEADVFFLDEPFSGIDAQSERLIFRLLQDLQKSGKTIVIVHHNLGHVSEYFSSVLLFNRGIIQYGKTSEVFTRENLMETYGGEVVCL